MMYVYMTVTPDIYELPIAVQDRLVDLEKEVGESASALCKLIRTGGVSRKGFKVVKVKLDD